LTRVSSFLNTILLFKNILYFIEKVKEIEGFQRQSLCGKKEIQKGNKRLTP